MSTKPIDYDSLQQHWGWLSPVGRIRGCSAAVGLRLSGDFGPSRGRLLLTPGPSAVEGDLGPSASVVLGLSGDFGPSRGCSRTQWREAAVDQVDGGCAVTTLEPAVDRSLASFFHSIKTVFQDFAAGPFFFK